MLTGSVFKSEYRGGDNIWRNTRLDRGYLFNALGGKEWIWGKQRQHTVPPPAEKHLSHGCS